MALEESGVKLVAEGAGAFLRAMEASNRAIESAGREAANAAKSAEKHAEAAGRQQARIDSLTDRIGLQNRQLTILQSELAEAAKKYGESSEQVQRKTLQVDRLSAAIRQNEQQLSAQQSALTKSQQAIESAAQSQQAAQRATEAATRSHAEAAMEAGRLALANIRLDDALEETAKSTTKAGDAFEKTVPPIQATNRALETVVREASQVDDAMGAAGRALDRAGQQFSAFEQVAIGALRRVGEMLTNFAVDAAYRLGGFLSDSISVAADYETAVGRFKAATGDALTEAGLSIKDFNRLWDQLGAQTEFSASQAVEAATELVKAGVPIEAVYTDATTAVVDLARAAELELGRAGTIVGKVLGAWADTGITATQAVDALAQTANASTADVEGLFQGIANAGGAAKALGINFQDTATVLGLIDSDFASTADAGTSLKVMMSSLTPASARATEAMQELGLITADGANRFFDAQGAFVGTEEAIRLLEEAFKGLTAAEIAERTESLFGQDAQRAALALLKKGVAGYRDLAAAQRSAGTAAEQAAAKNEGWNKAVQNLQGSVEGLQKNIGLLLKDYLQPLVTDGLTPAFNAMSLFALSLWESGNPIEALIGAIDEAIPGVSGLAEAFSSLALGRLIPDITALGSALQGTFTGAMAALSTTILPALADSLDYVNQHWEGFSGALGAVGAVLVGGAIVGAITVLAGALAALVSPIGLVVAGAALLGAAWAENWGGIQEQAAAAIAAVTPKLAGLQAALARLGTYLGGLIQPLVASLSASFQKLGQVYLDNKTQLDLLGGVLLKVGEAIGLVAGLAVGVLATAFGAVVAGLANALPSALQLAITTFNAVGNSITALGATLASFMNIFAQLIQGDWRGAWDAAVSFVSNAAGAIGTILYGAGEILAGVLQTVADVVIGAFQFVYDMLVGSSIIPDLVTGAIAWFSMLPAQIPGMVTGMVNTIIGVVTSALPNFMSVLRAWGNEAWMWIQRAIPELNARLTAWTSTVFTTLTTSFPVLVSNLLLWQNELWQWVARAIPVFVVKLGEYLTTFTAWAVGVALPEFIAKAAEFAFSLYDWIVSILIPESMARMLQWLANMLAMLTDIGKKLALKAYELGENMIESLTEAIAAGASSVVHAIVDAVRQAIAAAQAILGIGSPSRVFRDFGEQTMVGLANGIVAGAGLAATAMGNALGEVLGMVPTALGVGLDVLPSRHEFPLLDSLGRATIEDTGRAISPLGGRVAPPASPSQLAAKSIANTYNKSFTYAPQITTNQAPPPALDIAMARVLGGV